MSLRRILIIVLCFCFYDAKLAAMNAVADELLAILKSVSSNKVGTELGVFVNTRNDEGCKLDDQAVSLSKHLRISRHFGDHPSVLRDFGDGVKECMLGTSHINSSLFNVNADIISADIADTVTREVFNLLFKTEKASFFVPETTVGGNRIILKTKLTGHAVLSLKSDAGLYSIDKNDAASKKISTNIFGICVRVQKQYTAPNGSLVPFGGSKTRPHAQTIIISIYPEDPLDPDGAALPPVSE